MRGRMLLLLIVVLLGAGAARGQAEPVRFQDRNWRVGLMLATTWNDRFDVFGRPGLPPGPVQDEGGGGGLFLGRRFGQRFLLDMQLVASQHDVTGEAETMTGEARLAKMREAETLLIQDAGVMPFYYYVTRNWIDTDTWGDWYPTIQDFHPLKPIYKK